MTIGEARSDWIYWSEGTTIGEVGSDLIYWSEGTTIGEARSDLIHWNGCWFWSSRLVQPLAKCVLI